MKKSFLILLALAACAPTNADVKKTGIGGTTATILGEIEDQARRAEKALRGPDISPEVLEAVRSMEVGFNELKGMKPPKGDKDLWRQYCEVGLGILSDAKAQLNRSYLSAAQSSLARVRPLIDDIQKDFSAGTSTRFIDWLKSLFSRNPKKSSK